MSRIISIFFILSYTWAACPEGFYEDDCGTCWMPYCYDYGNHSISYDLEESECDGLSSMWIVPGDSGDPFF